MLLDTTSNILISLLSLVFVISKIFFSALKLLLAPLNFSFLYLNLNFSFYKNFLKNTAVSSTTFDAISIP